jgi:hypothetical protein
VVAGLVVVEAADGSLQHFERLGFIVIGAILITWILMYSIQRKLDRRPVEEKPSIAAQAG